VLFLPSCTRKGHNAKVVEFTWKSTDALILIEPDEAFSTYIIQEESTKKGVVGIKLI
jgi:hypothetical protein